MKVITYLGFTVLSIFIQFCVMDFIQEKIQIKETPASSNITRKKKVVDDLLKNISSKPHALYYRTYSTSLKRAGLLENYSNSSATTLTSEVTDTSTTVLDVLYDENTSTTETTTLESFVTTEFDNATDITFFETNNKSSVPNIVPNISFSKHCGCNLLFKVCDINCCCDQDCTIDEQKYFSCKEKTNIKRFYNDGCVTHLLDGSFRFGSSMLDNLFCVVKTNLPEKRNIKKPNLALIGQYHKWKNIIKEHTPFEFKKTLYSQGDPVWILKNGTIYYLDFPIPMINNYCTDRAPVTFLKDEKVQCIVKLEDLEMSHVSRTFEQSVVISATENTFNSSALNCSNLHCVNWTVLACDNGICSKYNKSSNEATCTKSACTNVAFKIEYLFYFNHHKITNATVKLYTQNISNLMPFLSQEINVKFVMSNKSLENVIEFSGNPGYMNNMPIIISTLKGNFTDNFFNRTAVINRMILPENHNGKCVLSNSSNNVVRFGVSNRMKCRYMHQQIGTQNNTTVCKSIQDNINKLLGIYQGNLSISPLGNPYGIKDEDWIKLQTEVNSQEPVYGAYSDNKSKLYCYNLINRFSLFFIFANVDEKDQKGQNKILIGKYGVVLSNASFNVEEISLVLTIDVFFLDATKPNLYEYAGSPHLNIHLPKDFFFPFPSNNCLHACDSYITTLFCVILLLCK